MKGTLMMTSVDPNASIQPEGGAPAAGEVVSRRGRRRRSRRASRIRRWVLTVTLTVLVAVTVTVAAWYTIRIVNNSLDFK